MIRTRLTSESRRVCYKHPDRPATHKRISVESARAGEYTATRKQCAECASKPVRPNETLRTL